MVLDLSNNLISFQQGPPTMAQQRVQYDTPTTIITTTMESEEENMGEIQAQNQSPLQYLTKVERINLKNNLISKIFMDWTFAPTNLRSLDLSRNKIKSLHPRDLYFVSQYKHNNNYICETFFKRIYFIFYIKGRPV
jgi:Leucine-rich repeat (LRR) protein